MLTTATALSPGSAAPDNPLQQLATAALVSIIPWLGTILAVAATVLVALVLYFLVRRTLALLEKRGHFSPQLTGMTMVLLRWLLVVVVILLSLQWADVEVGSLWAGLLTVLGLVAIGFVAVWSILSNVMSAILLVIFRPFAIGDEVEVIEPTGGKGLRGRVVNINLIYTVLEEPLDDGRHALTQVPNNVFFQKTVRRLRSGHTKDLGQSLFEEPAPEGSTEGRNGAAGAPPQS